MPDARRRFGGLYLVTGRVRPVHRLAAIVEAAIDGGAALVQFREKTPTRDRLGAARTIMEVCRRGGVPVLVNDDPEFAHEVGADGVHVGREDPSPREARRILGPRAIVGATVYGDYREVATAQEAGADYLAVGPFHPSPTKPDEPILPLTVLDDVVRRSRVPVFAIGGITAKNAGEVASHGVAGVAVVSAIMGAPDPRQAAADILKAFDAGRRVRAAKR